MLVGVSAWLMLGYVLNKAPGDLLSGLWRKLLICVCVWEGWWGEDTLIYFICKDDYVVEKYKHYLVIVVLEGEAF